MVGYSGESGNIFYRCESAQCHYQVIDETELIAVVITTVENIATQASNASEAVNATLLTSIKNLGRRLGLLRARQEIQPAALPDIVRELLSHEDRSVPQA